MFADRCGSFGRDSEHPDNGVVENVDIGEKNLTVRTTISSCCT
jgi:hypothetical protein